MGWKSIVKAAGKASTSLVDASGKSVGMAAKGIGEGLGATAKGLGGWKGVVGTGAVMTAVSSDHGLTGVASNVLFGKDGAERVEEHGVAGEALNIAIGEKGKQAVSDVTDAAVNKAENIGSSIQDMAGQYQAADSYANTGTYTSQSPMDMGGNFLSNLTSGNVSTMSMAAMIASSLMVFGRFSLLTKALGALLGIHTIGKNSHPMAVRQPVQQMPQETRQTEREINYPETEVIERSRGLGR